MSGALPEYNAGGIEPAAERLMVCVGRGPSAEDLVHAAGQLAARTGAPWIAVHVETARDARLSAAYREQVARTLQVAEQLGGETATLAGQNVADELIAYAASRKVTKIIVGNSSRSRWREWFSDSLASRLVRKCSAIDVYVVRGTHEIVAAAPRPAALPRTISYFGYFGAVAVVATCTGLGFLMAPYFAPANIIMVYLLGVVAISFRLGRGPSVLASMLAVAAFDFFFIPPYWTFTVDEKQYFVVFAVMLFTGLVISALTTHLRFQLEAARSRERTTAALYAMSRDLVHISTITGVVEAAAWHIGEVFDAEVFMMLPGDLTLDLRPVAGSPNHLETVPSDPPVRASSEQLGISEFDVPAVRLQMASTSGKPIDKREQETAQWVFKYGEPAGFGTSTLPSSMILFVPMPAQEHRVGVLGIQPRGQVVLAPDQVRLLQTFAGQIALAIVRIQSSTDAQRARLQVESERLRSSTLNAVSRDLRTPLATVVGASATLIEGSASLTAESRQQLAKTIYTEAERLNRLITNLLDMTSLEAGTIQVHREWRPLDELIGEVLSRLARVLGNRAVVTHVPANLPTVRVDEALLHKVLANLLVNAHCCAAAESPIELSASIVDGRLELEVADRGPNFVPGEERLIFEKSYDSTGTGSRTAAGFGLAFCRGVVELLGGWILAENRVGGGVVFHISLPQPAEADQPRTASAQPE